mgnify:CR=1 FL=1
MSTDSGAFLADPNEGQLKRALGLPSLVLFGLVYMVPLTVFTTYGIVTETSGGRLPLAYIVTLITMVFTALSYARMSAAIRASSTSTSTRPRPRCASATRAWCAAWWSARSRRRSRGRASAAGPRP